MQRKVDPRIVRYLATHDVPCPNCRYNLRGLQRDWCPECGWGFNFVALVRAGHPFRRISLLDEPAGEWLAILTAAAVHIAYPFWGDGPVEGLARVLLGRSGRAGALFGAALLVLMVLRWRHSMGLYGDHDRTWMGVAWGLIGAMLVMQLWVG